MFRIFKAVLYLAVIGFAGLTGYAYFGDMTPERAEIKAPVTLNAGK